MSFERSVDNFVVHWWLLPRFLLSVAYLANIARRQRTARILVRTDGLVNAGFRLLVAPVTSRPFLERMRKLHSTLGGSLSKTSDDPPAGKGKEHHRRKNGQYRSSSHRSPFDVEARDEPVECCRDSLAVISVDEGH